MHYHLEIILPPVSDVKSAVAQIMSQFNENNEDDDLFGARHGFWDFYVIGGRYSGWKLLPLLDQSKVDEFNQELSKHGVTVSGVRCGKPEISPISQIPMVDALWNKFFPDSPVKTCPFFNHFNDQYKDTIGYPDVMRLKDIADNLECSRVIIAAPHYKDEGKLEVTFMVQNSFWNGVNHYETKWGGGVLDAVKEYNEYLDRYSEDYKLKCTTQDDWLVVTVDYHS